MRTKSLKPEQLLAKRVAAHIKLKYPKQIFRFDTGADIYTNINSAKFNKELHGKFNKGYPDLLIPHLKKYKGNWRGGIYLELKATKQVPNSEHTRRQAAIHAVLRSLGFECDFCCGYDECIKKIDDYMLYEKDKKKLGLNK